MINLCVCTNLSLREYTGGVDRIINLAKGISKHEVTVYVADRTIRKSLFSFFFDDDKYYEIRNGIIRERCYPLYIRFLFPGLIKLTQEILNRLVSLVTCSFSSEVNLAYIVDPHLIVKLLYICRKEKIDLIQCEFHTTVLSSSLTKKLLSIPLIYDSHNIETERLRTMGDISSVYTTISRLVENASCRVSDLIFVVSENDRDKYASWHVPESKMEIIPNSVDVDRFSAFSSGSEIRDLYELNDKVVLIFHGTLSYPPNEEAAMILVHEILPNILEKCDDVHLLLVGKNPPEVSHPNIVVTGFVKDLPEYIAAADIAVVPLLKGGGTKIKILEYMACGKPVVSTMKGAEGLSVQDGREILLSRYPDSEFIDLVLKLVNDKDLRRKLGARARKKIEACYDWEKNAEKAALFVARVTQNAEAKGRKMS
jgi:glycosyltransferase involved in cell wall biosynthesis